MDWLLSADNHIVEPEDMFIKRLPKNLRERAPRYVNEGGNIVAYVDGVIRQVIPEVAFGTEMWPEKNDDIPARLEMLERDGVWGEAILGNLTGVVGMCIEEPDFAMACARAYNDWLVETFEPYRDRVVGHAFIPVCTDPKDSVAEV